MAQLSNPMSPVSPETSSDENKKAKNRISLSTTRSGSPIVVPAPGSPTPSVHLILEPFSSEKEVVMTLPHTPGTPSSTRAIKSPNPQDNARDLAQARRASAIIAAGGSWFDGASSSSENEIGADEERANESSDDREEGVIFAAARQAKRNRPRIIEHRNGSSSQLHRGGSLPRMAGVNSDPIAPHTSKNGSSIDVIERPAVAADKFASIDVKSEIADSLTDLGMNRGRQHSLFDALRSHPVDSAAIKRASTLPTRRKKTAFVPALENVDTKKGRWERQSVVSTPYPVGLKDAKEGSDWDLSRFDIVRGLGSKRKKQSKDEESMEMKEINIGRGIGNEIANQAVLTIVLYPVGALVPKVGKVFIPRGKRAGQRKASIDSKETFPMRSKAKALEDLDDEGLSRLVRAEFTMLRGSVRAMVSARSLKSLRLRSYKHMSQLAVGKDLVTDHSQRFQILDEMFMNASFLRLYRSPASGKGKSLWVEWVISLPENAGMYADSTEKVAVEFVEGWDGWRIALAIGAVTVTSVVVMLLWVFLGAGGRELSVYKGSLTQEYVGHDGAGGRLEAGAALGVLTLLVGWTGIGAWILLSWLVL